MGGYSAEALEIRQMRALDPELEALFALASGTTCADWPALYDLAVTLVGPLRERPGPAILSALSTFDAIHDGLWLRCKLCRRLDCLRCHPAFGPTDRQIITARGPEIRKGEERKQLERYLSLLELHHGSPPRAPGRSR